MFKGFSSSSRGLRVASASAFGFTMLVGLAVFGGGAISAQGKQAVQLPVALSKFRGFENWLVVSISQTDDVLKVILDNPTIIDLYRHDMPGNARPFPDGSAIAKFEWKPKKSVESLFSMKVSDPLADILFSAKASKRYSDNSGWRFAQSNYDAASDTFTLNGSGVPCGYACYMIAKAKD